MAVQCSNIDPHFEELTKELCDERVRAAYKQKHDAYHLSVIPRLLGNLLIFCGNVIYGKEPSYLKFRSVEIIARVPYHSWTSSAFTVLTLFFADEKRALALSCTAKYAEVAQTNETMHVVVISQLATRAGHHAGVIRFTLIPVLFSFFYFWASYFLHLVAPRLSYELNYAFENHAYTQYDQFIQNHAQQLKERPVESEFLAWYGRTPKNEYDFFTLVRNDELIHRNKAIEDIEMLQTKRV